MRIGCRCKSHGELAVLLEAEAARQRVGRDAHTLDAAHKRHASAARVERHVGRGAHERLEATAAETRHAVRGRRLGHADAQPDVARQIRRVGRRLRAVVKAVKMRGTTSKEKVRRLRTLKLE